MKNKQFFVVDKFTPKFSQTHDMFTDKTGCKSNTDSTVYERKLKYKCDSKCKSKQTICRRNCLLCASYAVQCSTKGISRMIQFAHKTDVRKKRCVQLM